MPEAFKEFVAICDRLEAHYLDTCRISSSPSSAARCGCCRRGQASARLRAAKIAVDMVDEKMITEEQAVLRIEPSSPSSSFLDQLLHPTIDPRVAREVIGTGFRRRPVLHPARSSLPPKRRSWRKRRGGKVILLRVETSPSRISTACMPPKAS